MSDDEFEHASRQDFTDLGVAITATLVTLTRLLDGQQVFSRSKFAEGLRHMADNVIPQLHPDHPDGAQRLDCVILRNLADGLDGKTPSPWKPFVIPGGKAT